VTGWREEARQDRLVRARIEQDRAEASGRVRIAAQQAAAAERRADETAQAAARDQAQQAAGRVREQGPGQG